MKKRRKKRVEVDYVDRYVHARGEINQLYQWLEALAHYAAKRKPGKWFYDTLGGKPKSRKDLLLKIAEVVKAKAIRVGDLEMCCNNCKSLYFCEKKRGHKGKHSTGGLVWE